MMFQIIDLFGLIIFGKMSSSMKDSNIYLQMKLDSVTYEEPIEWVFI